MKPISYLIEKVVDSLPLKASSLLGMSVDELEEASLYGILDRFAADNNILYIVELVCDPVIVCGALENDDPTLTLNKVRKLKRLLLANVDTFEVNATCSIIEQDMEVEYMMYYNKLKIPIEETLKFALEFSCQYLLYNIDYISDVLVHAASKKVRNKQSQTSKKKQK